MSIIPIYGLPGVRPILTANHRTVFLQSGPLVNLAGGHQISGAASRDPGNDDPTRLRAGLIMGKISTVVNSIGSVGQYAPSILGVTTGAYTSGGTSLTVSAAQAVEIARRVGSSGTATLKVWGPPTAAGTVASTAMTYSALNTTTGVFTLTSLGVDKVAGSLITSTDGSETPLIMTPDGYPIAVSDNNGVADQPFPFMPIWAVVETSKLINYPADASLRTAVKQALSTLVGGKYSFDDTY